MRRGVCDTVLVMKIGYGRVSTRDQHPESHRQRDCRPSAKLHADQTHTISLEATSQPLGNGRLQEGDALEDQRFYSDVEGGGRPLVDSSAQRLGGQVDADQGIRPTVVVVDTEDDGATGGVGEADHRLGDVCERGTW